MIRGPLAVALTIGALGFTGCAFSEDQPGTPAQNDGVSLHGLSVVRSDAASVAADDPATSASTENAQNEVDPAVLAGVSPMTDAELRTILGHDPSPEMVQAFAPEVVAKEHAISAASVNYVLGYEPAPQALERTQAMRAGLRATLYQLRSRFQSGAIDRSQHRAARKALWHRFMHGLARVFGCSFDQARRILLHDRSLQER